jgi:hypothetical protein
VNNSLKVETLITALKFPHLGLLMNILSSHKSHSTHYPRHFVVGVEKHVVRFESTSADVDPLEAVGYTANVTFRYQKWDVWAKDSSYANPLQHVSIYKTDLPLTLN